MFIKPEHFRYERKYIWPYANTATIERLLSSHAALFHQPYPPRWVSSVYYDSPDCALLQQNSLGMQTRIKVRARWYQQDDTSTKPHLEIKHKQAEMNTKHFFDIDFDHNSDKAIVQTWYDISPQVQQAVAEHVSISQLLQPSLQNRYFRQYYESPSLQIRVTLDTQLAFKHPRQGSRFHSVGFSIVEIKAGRKADLNISRIVSSLPLRVSKASKYEMGMRLVALC